MADERKSRSRPQPRPTPVIGDVVSATTYAALAAHQIALPLSSAHSVKKVSDKITRRGKAIQSGERPPARGKVGRNIDGIAKRVASVSTSRTAGAVRTFAQSPAGKAVAFAANIASRVALPLLAAKAGVGAGVGYQRDGVRGAILGAGDAIAFGRFSAAYDGFQKGGILQAADAATFGVGSAASEFAAAAPEKALEGVASGFAAAVAAARRLGIGPVMPAAQAGQPNATQPGNAQSRTRPAKPVSQPDTEPVRAPSRTPARTQFVRADGTPSKVRLTEAQQAAYVSRRKA